MTKVQKTPRTHQTKSNSSKTKGRKKVNNVDFVSHESDYRPLRHVRRSLFRQSKTESLSIM